MTKKTNPFKNSYGSTVTVTKDRDGSFRIVGCGIKAKRATLKSAMAIVSSDARFQGWAA